MLGLVVGEPESGDRGRRERIWSSGRGKAMDALWQLLPHILRELDYQEDVCQEAAFVAWNHAVGEVIANQCAPLRLHNKRLIILTISRVWKQQLQAMSSQIIFKINRLLGAPVVAHIEYRIDAQQVMARRQQREEIHFERLQEMMKDLESDAEVIDDPECRRAFLRAASKCLARRGVETDDR